MIRTRLRCRACAVFAVISVCSLRAAADPPTEETRVGWHAAERGFLFFPSRTASNTFRFGLGMSYDAIDPQVMYGLDVRVPQLTFDARYGLGRGWSLKGHLNSFLVTSELLLGVGYAWQLGPISVEASASVGIYVGQLNRLNFSTTLIAPEYRPELAVGWDLGVVALSLRGSLLLMGPEQVRVGEVWGGLDNSDLFVGHSEMLMVENTLASGAVWYFGAGVLTTRAYYQMWLLFPDSAVLFTYARMVVGYEF